MAEAETYEEIRDDIEQQRGELAGNINRLESTVKDAFDVRRLVEERPLDVALVALGVGLYLADRTRRDGRHAPEHDELAETVLTIRDALLRLGKRQAAVLTQSATAGLRN